MATFGSEDFISFDFDDDGGGAGVENISVNAAPGPSKIRSSATSSGKDMSSSALSRRISPPPASRTHANDTPQSNASTSSKGKKRKFDDDDEDEEDEFASSMTKKERERAAARGTPWSVNVNWDTARNAAQQLHREMIAFEGWLSPTRQEHECRQMVIALIRKAITSQWRDAEVHSFGSQDTELYLPQGDIDLVVVSDAMEYQRREGVLRAMAACLRRNNLATDVQVIARAKVPIIKFVCTHGRYRCDISVNQTNGLKAADFVNRMQSDMPAIRPLIMLTKHLLQQRGMSEVYTGGLGSFSVILLVVNFMQIHPKVQRGEIDPTRNLGVLFLDFLELYGKNFGYDDTGITVRGEGGYFHKSRRGWKDHSKPWKLSIEDPQNAENDISTGSYNIISVRSALSGAFDMLTSAVCQRGIEMAKGGGGNRRNGHMRFGGYDGIDDDTARSALLAGPKASRDKDPQSLLGSIVGVSRELLKARKDLLALYDSGVLQRLCGKPPPGRDPSPGPSSSSSRRHWSSRPPSPSATPPPPPPPRDSPHKARVNGSSGVQSIINIKGRAAGPHASTPLRGDVISIDDSSSDGEESRYSSKKSNKRQRSRKTKAYVSEESESDSGHDGGEGLSYEDEDEDSIEIDDSDGGGKAAHPQQPRRSGNNDKTRQFWLDKAGVGLADDSAEDEYEYGSDEE